MDCLRSYVTVDLKDISKYPFKCFFPECETLLQYNSVEYVLEPEQLNEYDRMLIKSSDAGKTDGRTISCPTCKAVMFKSRRFDKIIVNNNNSDNKSNSNEINISNNNSNNNNNNETLSLNLNDGSNEIAGNEKDSTMKNNNSNKAMQADCLMHCVNSDCKTALCARCECLWHYNITCEEYQEKMAINNENVDEAFASLIAQEKWSKCPQCGVVVERTEGCFHMTHKNCPNALKDNRTDFCYCM